ncbi:tyrosine-type recombinase/integrase [Sutcliffiella horikoshii]|uniref:tyrosine-type recombinase/integrase n=1 Tax=Sutcliffiella horikoshii TaxID=79883 RepID=UPI003CE90218
MPCEPIKDKEIIKDMFEALALRPNGATYVLYLEFALSTALRVSDILSLRKRDIRDGMVRIKTSKTNTFKKIELNPSCRKKMEMYLQFKKPDDYIFPWKRQWSHKLLKYAAEFAGIPKDNVSCHTTRKTAAYWYYRESNFNIQKTMQLLGHKDAKVTREYLLISDDEVNEELVGMTWS